jgi:hypothetical protein
MLVEFLTVTPEKPSLVLVAYRPACLERDEI